MDIPNEREGDQQQGDAISSEEMQTCLKVLQQVADSHRFVSKDDHFYGLIQKIFRDGKRYRKDKRSAVQHQKVAEDKSLLASTAMVQTQRDALPVALPPLLQEEQDTPKRVLNNPRTCYICKEPFKEVHFFYHQLCPKCADYNYQRRYATSDLWGRTALVTGGRVKIGHQTVLRLLRDGAKVIVTTRFPHAAAKRFHSEADSAEWIHRLQVCGLDLRNIPAVEAFAHYLMETEPALDMIIHNAAQTIRRPRGFYNEMIRQELNPEATVPEEARRLVLQGAPSTLAIADTSPLLDPVLTGGTPLGLDIHTNSYSITQSGMTGAAIDLLPVDRLADNEELADSRQVNSWLLKLDEVGPQETLEVQLVNSVAPFLLNSRLKPLMMRSAYERRFIVNVSAMEGQFARHKTVYHPHTNMAKAALNMMTRTSGADYAEDNIFMTSVDTGWVTDENPTPIRLRNQEELGFFAPLDIIDGMARIYHPIADGINLSDVPYFGVFLKDYAPCPW